MHAKSNDRCAATRTPARAARRWAHLATLATIGALTAATHGSHLTTGTPAWHAAATAEPPAPATPPAAPAPAAPAQVAPSAATAALNGETFDAVWAIVRDTHWDPTLGNLDWAAVRAELRPAAERAATVHELRVVLNTMLQRLGQSHFAILPGETLFADDDAPHADASTEGAAADSDKAGDANSTTEPTPPTRKPQRRAPRGGNTGASLALLPAPGDAHAREAVIVRVAEGSSAAEAGLAPGAVVLAIGGKSPLDSLPEGEGLERYERAAIVNARATGEPGATITWRIREAGGAERDVELTYAPDTRPRLAFGNLPPFPVAIDWGTVDGAMLARCNADGATIGRITFSGWFIPVALPFNQAIDALRTSDGIVIDLRGNPGGLGGMAMGIAGHFTPASERLGTMYTRGSELNFITNPRTVSVDGESVEVFGGPVAILVDTTTASTSEIFAGGMQHLGRARVFGMRSAGAALPSILDPLPNGDVFLHAIADYRLPDGRALEAAGVKPDDERPYTRLDYARDGDPVLADAVRWIATQRAPRTQEHTP